MLQVKIKFRLKIFNLDFDSQFYLSPSPDYSYCRVLYNDSVWSFNFLQKYSLNQFIYFLIFYFFLFLLQGHRFLGKTHQRNWYETASTGTGYLLPLF